MCSFAFFCIHTASTPNSLIAQFHSMLQLFLVALALSMRSQPAWTGSGKALANSSPHQPIPGDMTFHNTLSTCLVTVLCEASMITLQTVDDWPLSCSDASSDGMPYRFTKCDVSLRRCKIEQTKVFPNRFPSTKLCTNLDEPGILASL